MKEINDYKVYIFDVDGTLYSKRKMHLYMGLKLIKYFSIRLYKMDELIFLIKFRKNRENQKYASNSVYELVSIMCNYNKTKSCKMNKVIEKWLYNEPLNVINKCSYFPIIDFINKNYKKKRFEIYSDYPAENKVCALKINVDNIFTSEDKNILSLKPDRNAMNYILKTINESCDDILYIGDRDEKDGESARLAGIDYCDVILFKNLVKMAD